MKKENTEDKLYRGLVLSTSRRSVTLCDDNFQVIEGELSTKTLEVTVGDTVFYENVGGRPFVKKIQQAKNELSRSYFNQTRRIVANVDHLFIGAAVPPLFNTVFIDRLITLARLQGIPTTLLINKIDLGLEDTELLLSTYQTLDVDILLTSALKGEGVQKLVERLSDTSLKMVVFAGISGVGKSTLVNLLVPGAKQRTAEVSQKTGQGKQTTAQPLGHIMKREEAPPLIVVDLPGIQSFGVQHLDISDIIHGFVEFEEIRTRCKYSDCLHIREDHCAIKECVESGEISPSRYLSYVGMIDEIESAKKF